MKIIGITGKIGAGKSVIASFFSFLHAKVVEVDIEAKKLYYREEIRKKVEDILKQSILSPDGEVDFRVIATKYFSSIEIYDAINSILYPVLKEEMHKLVQMTSGNILVFDAAMLYEIGLDTLCDLTVVVKAPLKLRWERVKKRNPKMKRKDFLLRDRLQDAKSRDNVFVIKNDERHSILEQFEKFVIMYLR